MLDKIRQKIELTRRSTIRKHTLLKNYDFLPTTFREVWVESNTRARTYGHIHRPADPGKYPTVILIPGGEGSGSDFGKEGRLSADDIAALGFVAMHYDPQGRGNSGGTEYFWGPGHQDELHRLLKYVMNLPEVNENQLGIISLSIGIVIAGGALARYPDDPKVDFLFDWEGPSNKKNITLNGTHPELMRFPLSDDEFWGTRQATEYIDKIRCGYFRFQGEKDHFQGKFKGHAFELLNRATKGQASWTRCNDNPPDIIYDSRQEKQYQWISFKRKSNRPDAALFIGNHKRNVGFRKNLQFSIEHYFLG